jgi:hypothetical protein
MKFHERASIAADQISAIIDDLMASRPYPSDAEGDLEISVLARELTKRQPRVMRILVEDPLVQQTLEATLSKIPATRPRGRGA